ncbi:tol-pal system protein YbgF [Vibrio renipiscarius]|uniref:Cell division coordinator CpoB n=1 Tax=Vibrio renipiscarius TaxID=1461322 RepID=A0A0C2NC53_9VIBR|nr:tol-pal system protein YbgF [Vibrio renipiscarius]KII77046.1 tol-pal system protein [Vibrio renipiscarius]KII77176.1 tol-pal system protein [Vibrio renipiscarius]
MFSNLKQVISLTLLASAANIAFAAPAPVADLGGSTSTSRTFSSSESDIQRLERLLENRNRVQLKMQQQLDTMSLEVSDLRGQIEKNNYDMQQMLQRQRELFVELDKVRQDAKTAAVVPVVTDAKPVDTQGTFSSNANEQTAYQDAVDLILKQRDYSGAISAFVQFQKDYPNSTFMPNSHYWLGQLYFAKKQDKEAVKSFTAVLTYQESNKRADALVKLGDIAERNNNAEQAKKYYQQVVTEYPDSASAKVAQKKLN